MTRVLLTCFDPFAGAAVNASEQAVMAVDASALPEDVELTRVRLPTVFGDSVRVLHRAIEERAPDVIICVGQAGPHPAVAVESVAKNWDAASIPDNAGKQPAPGPCIVGAPATLPSTLPIESILKALSEQGLHARLSESAGDFVCNHLFYGLMHELGLHEHVRGGFIHLPCRPEDAVGGPGLDTASAARALETIVHVCVIHA